MQQIPEGIDPEIWSQIQETFDKIKEDAGIEPDEEYMSELEELLGMSVDEMNEGHMKMIKTRTVGVELVHDDAKFPTYAYPSDSGFDLYSTIEHNLPPFGRALIPTGLKLSIPEISKGMKIAQAVLCPVVNGKYVSLELVEKVEDKERGDNGFGSTGIK